MNEKTKKVVAGIVLGTFTFGCVTPAFASEENSKMEMSATYIQPNLQSVKDMPLIYSNSDIDTYGIKGITLKALKELIDTNWTKITTLLIDLNVEIELVTQLNELKSTFFSLLDVYFDVSDTAHEAIRKSLVGLGFHATVASIIADAICLIIF